MNTSPDLNRDPTYDAPMEGRRAGNGQAAEASLGVLLRELAHEVPSLLSKEVALAKSEARESLQLTKAGVIALAGGGAVLMAGVIVLMLSAVYALSLVMASWLAALIVGAVVTLIGVAMVRSGRRKLESDALRPQRSLDTLHKHREVIRGRTQ